MKKDKKTNVVLFSIVAVALFLGTISVANAFRGDFAQMGPNYSNERHALMQKAFETNDYNLWKSQMQGRGRMMDFINENNFSRFAEMHRLMNAGKYDEARKIRAELGMGNGAGHCGNRGNKIQNN